MKENYRIDPSKAVVGVNRPMKALSMHIQKPYVQCVYIAKAKYQIVPSKAVVGVDQPMMQATLPKGVGVAKFEFIKTFENRLFYV